jgi:hypothetical protein
LTTGRKEPLPEPQDGMSSAIQAEAEARFSKRILGGAPKIAH